MDVRTTFIIALGIVLFTMYYLEKEMERDQIYWLFAGLSVATGIATAYFVAKRSQFYEFSMILTVVFILIAILYLEDEEIEVKEKKGKRKKKEDKKPVTKKGKGIKKGKRKKK